ncbi:MULTISPECIES: NAD(P)H-dependent oxidoreductase [Rhodomicrobium]|uniref:glutathione-regulated potassium-efflux system oxidoreductase KefF n=1 Tax=Rhodomicrobium TaxID=1068 RepID=UPI000B4B924E|nr:MULTISPECIES: NAD(P)H-dependent oxidoreductase [Rhodomicrobium]
MPSKVLILLAHPALQRSRVNRALVRAVTELQGVTLHDLYETYPDFMIDVEHEQSLLLDHDIIVFQHPFYWYSAPALVKEWLDLVLEHGFAYGREGTALRGKAMMSAISTGGGEDAYHEAGMNRYSITELLRPFEQTARLCGMEWLPHFAVHGTHSMDIGSIQSGADDYRILVTALTDRMSRDAQRAMNEAQIIPLRPAEA